MLRNLTFAACASLAIASPGFAASVFFDDFSGDAANVTNTALTNFNVTGNVDVVGNSNPWGIVTPGGNVVDLDGSPGPGKIASKSTYSFNAGDVVTLSVLLGGAQRGSNFDGFSFGFDFGASETIEAIGVAGHFVGSLAGPAVGTGLLLAMRPLAGNADYLTTSFTFTALTSGNLSFFFESNSADNIGPLMTDVNLDITPSAVPLPAGGLLLLAGLGSIAAFRRKKA